MISISGLKDQASKYRFKSVTALLLQQQQHQHHQQQQQLLLVPCVAEAAGHVLCDGGDGLIVEISEGSIALELLQVQLFAVAMCFLN